LRNEINNGVLYLLAVEGHFGDEMDVCVGGDVEPFREQRVLVGLR
jgi:hypothetical protein